MTSVRSFDQQWTIDNLSKNGKIIPHVERAHPTKKLFGVLSQNVWYSAGLIARTDFSNHQVIVDYFEPCRPNLSRYGLDQHTISLNGTVYNITLNSLDKSSFNKLYTEQYLNDIHGSHHKKTVEIEPAFDRPDVELGVKTGNLARAANS